MADIFISYSRHDAVKAQELAERIRAASASVWMDTAALAAAETWSAEIVHAIKECTIFIVMLSPSSVASPNVIKEVSLASERRKTIVPIVLEKCELGDALEYALAGLQQVQLSDEETLVRSLEKLGIGMSNAAPVLDQPVAADVGQGKLRLAVLPFADLSPGHDHEWFAEGMMDELINALGHIEKLHVSPKGDILHYKEHRPKLSQIATELGCQFIVEGGVQKSGEKIRIRVSLSDAAKHKQLWSEKYDGTFDDIFDLQDKTCFAIAETLKVTLTVNEERGIEKRSTQNPEAYELYMKAMEAERRTTAEGTEMAIRLLEAALELDPKFALAYDIIAGICLENARVHAHDKSWHERGIRAVEKLIEIEGESTPVLLLKSNLASLAGDHETGLLLARRALEMDANDPNAYYMLANAYERLGKIEQAADISEQLPRLSNNNANAHFLHLIFLNRLGDIERLRAAAQRALPFMEKYHKKHPEDTFAEINYAIVLAWAGRKEEAERRAKVIASLKELKGLVQYNAACLYLHLGWKEEGLVGLRRAVESGFSSINFLREDRILGTVRDTPEFQNILHDLEQRLASPSNG